MIRLLCFALTLMCFNPLHAQRGESSPVVVNIFSERQKERRSSRWSLASWMKTKQKVAEQNAWLWAHTNKIPMEWAAGYTQSTRRWEVDAEAFIARLGLRMTHQRKVSWFDTPSTDFGPNGHQTELAAQLRFFGGNLQDSHLIARVGFEYSEWTSPASLSGGSYGAWFVEPVLQLYLEQWIGVAASWKYRYTGAHMSRRTETLDGTHLELTAFLEMGALRFGGTWKQVKDEYSSAPGLPQWTEWSGFVKIYY